MSQIFIMISVIKVKRTLKPFKKNIFVHGFKQGCAKNRKTEKTKKTEKKLTEKTEPKKKTD